MMPLTLPTIIIHMWCGRTPTHATIVDAVNNQLIAQGYHMWPPLPRCLAFFPPSWNPPPTIWEQTTTIAATTDTVETNKNRCGNDRHSNEYNNILSQPAASVIINLMWCGNPYHAAMTDGVLNNKQHLPSYTATPINRHHDGYHLACDMPRIELLQTAILMYIARLRHIFDTQRSYKANISDSAEDAMYEIRSQTIFCRLPNSAIRRSYHYPSNRSTVGLAIARYTHPML